MKQLYLVIPFVFFSINAFAAGQSPQPGSQHGSHYAAEEDRAIKSLSNADIAELMRGGGWGLAKAAELNGVPGPSHLLKMKDLVGLDAGQVTRITKLYDGMKAKAIVAGELLIALERQLEVHFQNRTITDAILQKLLEELAQVRRELRYIHLSTHLETPKILTRQQIRHYNLLRGYASHN